MMFKFRREPTLHAAVTLLSESRLGSGSPAPCASGGRREPQRQPARYPNPAKERRASWTAARTGLLGNFVDTIALANNTRLRYLTSHVAFAMTSIGIAINTYFFLF
jgi:hypothetical protein